MSQECPAAQAATKALGETAAPGFFAARTVDIDGISTIPKASRLSRDLAAGLTLDLAENCHALKASLRCPPALAYRNRL